LCNAYKVFDSPHKPVDLETILAPPFVPSTVKEEQVGFKRLIGITWTAINFSYFRPEYNKDIFKLPNLDSKPYISTKAGPNHAHSVLGAGLDAYAWLEHYPAEALDRFFAVVNRIQDQDLQAAIQSFNKEWVSPLAEYWRRAGDNSTSALFVQQALRVFKERKDLILSTTLPPGLTIVENPS
jgi:hypothetical protein